MTTEQTKTNNKPWIKTLVICLTIVLISITLLSYRYLSTRVTVDRSIITAPVISISPSVQGTLDELYVRAGDNVKAGESIARVGGEVLYSKVDGEIIIANNTPGQLFSPSVPVVKMIVPSELKVIGTVKENEGLSKIQAGNAVTFTVDAFSGRKYIGVVDSIDPTSKDSSLTFNISDKREVKEFLVNIKFDTKLYPEFKNGMSAKMTIYTK